ncbi:MAG: dihydrolipoyl dehydrogenase [Chloroflexi bacterium]|nr:dihydrolipoyl dehydrogenase [Chloroflexota bacterium]
MAKQYDIAIIGGGPGGYVAAIRAAQLGGSIALLERDSVGGTCLNRGCIPTKTLVRSQEVLMDARNGAEYGVRAENVTLDFGRVMERKREVVAKLVAGTEGLLRGNKVDLYKVSGKMVSRDTIHTDAGDEIVAKKIVIATGSISTPVHAEGIDTPGVITSDDILELQKLPERLAIIGGGVIGMEFASIYNAFGSKVSVWISSPRLLRLVDEEIARRYNVIAKKQGMEINVNSNLKKVAKGDNGLILNFETPQGDKVVEADLLLLAKGRTPYSDDAGLETVGVERKGPRVLVNEYMETNVPGIYAIGDCVGGAMLAHKASYEGEVAVENALGRTRTADYHAVPDCIFTSPEIAGVGMDEEKAKNAGITYKVSKFPFSALGRANAMGETDGLVKILTEQDSGVIIGAQILGPRAADLIAELTLATQMRLTAKDVADTIHAHPTLPEAVMEAAKGQLEGSIHFLKR